MSFVHKSTTFQPETHSEDQRCRAYDGKPHKPCISLAVDGTERCEAHGANFVLDRQYKQEFRAYQLARWRSDLERFGDSPTLKSLREEIAISRLTLEAIVSKCESHFDLMLHSSKISMMLQQIEKLVVSCNKLEDRLGMVLDKSAIINLAENIVQIVSEHVDEETIEAVANKIAQAVEASGRVAPISRDI